jgi:hypothetical protein
VILWRQFQLVWRHCQVVCQEVRRYIQVNFFAKSEKNFAKIRKENVHFNPSFEQINSGVFVLQPDSGTPIDSKNEINSREEVKLSNYWKSITILLEIAREPLNLRLCQLLMKLKLMLSLIFKGTVSRDFPPPVFFQQSTPLITGQKPFRIRLRIRRELWDNHLKWSASADDDFGDFRIEFSWRIRSHIRNGFSPGIRALREVDW